MPSPVEQDSLLWGPLPTVAQVEALIRATTYSYEAGEYPANLDVFTQRFTAAPDGGLLEALAFLKRAVALLPASKPVESWHGRCGSTAAGWSNVHD